MEMDFDNNGNDIASQMDDDETKCDVKHDENDQKKARQSNTLRMWNQKWKISNHSQITQTINWQNMMAMWPWFISYKQSH